MRAIILFLFATSATAAPDAASIARLVHAESIDPALSEALRSGDALVRATAARVAGVRSAKGVLPVLREVVAGETDPSALREEIRTLALIGEHADVDLAIAAASKQSAAFDGVVADAVARRGGEDAIDLYMAKVRNLRDTTGFFDRALWGHDDYVSTTAGWLLSSRVANAWRELLVALERAGRAPAHARMMAGLENGSEDIRQESAWFLVRGYALDPGKLHESLKTMLLADRADQGSDREDFARELLRRMLGKEPSNPQRWLKWLASEEADHRLPMEPAVYTYLTPEELAFREARCKNLRVSCPVTPKSARRVERATEVAPASLSLPGLLPAGLAERILGGRKCEWIGLASATVDGAGRVQSLDLKQVTGSCLEQLETIVTLSYATNTTLASPRTAGDVLLAKAAQASLCLDESGDEAARVVRVGDRGVTRPVVTRRVPPRFPDSVRRTVGRGVAVEVVVEALISREGCVRSVNVVKQSRFPELNGMVVLAASQWKFEPARVDGKPVDAIFTLPVSFTVN